MQITTEQSFVSPCGYMWTMNININSDSCQTRSFTESWELLKPWVIKDYSVICRIMFTLHRIHVSLINYKQVSKNKKNKADSNKTNYNDP